MRTCNYCKNPRDIKGEFHVVKAKKEKAQRIEHKNNHAEEGIYYGATSTSRVTMLNITHIGRTSQ